MISALRKDDERCSDIVSQFLDENFYKKKTKKFSRITNKEMQVVGIDTTFLLEDTPYSCDEKAAIRYVNKGLQTFSLELCFVGRTNKLRDGWLINENENNNSFLFVWIDKAKKDLLESTSDIQHLEIALVKRDIINEYLSSLGWTRDKLMQKAKNILSNDNEYLGNLYKDGCKFVYSKNNLVEKPINLLLPRRKLIELSDYTEIFNME